MKRYKVIDRQGCDFMSYTHEKPLTANEIRSIRWCDYKDNFMDSPKNRMKWQNFTINFVCDFWEIDLEEA
jgi:hypothetical protein